MNARNYYIFQTGFLICLIFILSSCGIPNKNFSVPPELIGKWKSEMTKITVRTEPRWMKFEFTSDSAFITLQINSDKTASGLIGDTKFENGKLFRNFGNPDKTGVAYMIKCGSIRKIFKKDPLEAKVVEIWLGPGKEKGLLEAELRYTQGGSKFPMSGLRFRKEKN